MQRKFNDTHKWCPRCKDFLLREEFGKSISSASGLGKYCKKHINEISSNYRKNHPPRVLTEEQRLRGMQQATKWNIDNRDRRRKQKCNSPEYLRELRYGLTKEQYQKMWDEQGGLCKISFCGNPVDFVDHNHDTNEIRALLCQQCNSAMGFFRDNSELMRAAADYIDKFKNGGGIPIVKIQRERKPISQHTKNLHRLQMLGNTLASGHTAWNKGKEWSEEIRKKMSESAKRRRSKHEE